MLSWAMMPFLNWRTSTRIQREAAQALAGIEDLRAVGPLAEALEYRSPGSQPTIYPVITGALRRLLPRMQASDAHLLTEPQRSCLYRALLKGDAELVLAIVKALEQIGDGKALPYVEKLAEEPEVGTEVFPILTAGIRAFSEGLRGDDYTLRTPNKTGLPVRRTVGRRPYRRVLQCPARGFVRRCKAHPGGGAGVPAVFAGARPAGAGQPDPSSRRRLRRHRP
jgi:hypothetical protein